MQTIKELYKQLQQEIIIRTKYEENYSIIRSGFVHLGNLDTGKVIGIIGSNPDKSTALALSIALNAAAFDETFAMFFSLQHNTQKIFDHILAQQLHHKERNVEKLEPDNVKHLLCEISKLSDRKFYIVGKQDFVLPNMKKQVLEAWTHSCQPKCGLIVLDCTNFAKSINFEIQEKQFETMLQDAQTLTRELGITFLVLPPLNDLQKEQIKEQVKSRNSNNCDKKASLINKYADMLMIFKEDSTNIHDTNTRNANTDAALESPLSSIEIINKDTSDRKTITLCYLAELFKFIDYFHIP